MGEAWGVDFTHWWIVVWRPGGNCPLWGLIHGVSAKREGCSEAKPLGGAGGEREARAEGRRPVGAGGGVAPKRRRGLVPRDVKDL